MTDNSSNIVETALRIAEERRRILEKMRHALKEKDDERVKELAVLLCGMQND